MKTFREIHTLEKNIKKAAKKLNVPHLGVLRETKNEIHTPKRTKRSKAIRDAWARFGYEINKEVVK